MTHVKACSKIACTSSMSGCRPCLSACSTCSTGSTAVHEYSPSCHLHCSCWHSSVSQQCSCPSRSHAFQEQHAMRFRCKLALQHCSQGSSDHDCAALACRPTACRTVRGCARLQTFRAPADLHVVPPVAQGGRAHIQVPTAALLGTKLGLGGAILALIYIHGRCSIAVGPPGKHPHSLQRNIELTGLLHSAVLLA